MFTSLWPKNHVSRWSALALFTVLAALFAVVALPQMAFAIPEWAPLSIAKGFDTDGYHADYAGLNDETTFTATLVNPETSRELVFVSTNYEFFGMFMGKIYYYCGEYDSSAGDLLDPGAIVDSSGDPVLDLQPILDDAEACFLENVPFYEDTPTTADFCTLFEFSQSYMAYLYNLPNIYVTLTETPGADYTATYWYGMSGVEEVVGSFNLAGNKFNDGGTVEVRNFFKDPNAEPAGDGGEVDLKGSGGDKEKEGGDSTTKNPPQTLPSPIHVAPKTAQNPQASPDTVALSPAPVIAQSARTMPATGDIASLSVWLLMLIGSAGTLSALMLRNKL